MEALIIKAVYNELVHNKVKVYYIHLEPFPIKPQHTAGDANRSCINQLMASVHVASTMTHKVYIHSLIVCASQGNWKVCPHQDFTLTLMVHQ